MEDKNHPIAALSANDLQALLNILYFYERWLFNTLSPSSKRGRRITELQLLLVKISLLGTSKITTLTFDEVDSIIAAIGIFMKQVKERIPESESRDDVLESCEGLKAYFVKAFGQEK